MRLNHGRRLEMEFGDTQFGLALFENYMLKATNSVAEQGSVDPNKKRRGFPAAFFDAN